VRRSSARPDAAVRRYAASDAAPWPGAVAAEPREMRVPRAAPSLEAAQGEPSAQAEPSRAVVRGEPWRAAVQDGPSRAAVPQAVRAFHAAEPTLSHSLRQPRHREDMPQCEGRAKA